MTRSHFGFGHFDFRHLAGWHFRGGGGFLIFHGRGGVAAIDWDSPLAGTSEGNQQMVLNLPLPPDEVHALATQRLSASGVLERSRLRYVLLQADQAGNLINPLARIEDLAVKPLACDSLLVEFSCNPPTGYAQPDWFDVLTDSGTGSVDLQHPVATVPATQQTEYSFTFSFTRRPITLGVRPMSANFIGPLCVVVVPAQTPLQPPTTL